MSLIGTGQNYKNLALQGFRDLSTMEQKRDAANEQLDAQKKQSMVSTTLTGAGIGAYIGAGTSVGGPIGGIIGAAAGFLFSNLF